MSKMTTTTTKDTTAQARKRRKIHLSKQRSADDASSIASSADDSAYDDSWSADDDPKKPSIRGIKRQARYDPGVPMNREELKAWRKEARRVRNRESAAASRKRTRDRIEELEGQVQVLEDKYSAALQRIAELEADKMTTTSTQDLLVSATTVSPTTSPNLTPSTSPRSSFVLLATDEPMSLPSSSSSSTYFQHVMDPRPNAAKILTDAEKMLMTTMTTTTTGALTSTTEGQDNMLYVEEELPSNITDTSDLSSSSAPSSSDDDDDELGLFLMDALVDFDPSSTSSNHEEAILSLCV